MVLGCRRANVLQSVMQNMFSLFSAYLPRKYMPKKLDFEEVFGLILKSYVLYCANVMSFRL